MDPLTRQDQARERMIEASQRGDAQAFIHARAEVEALEEVVSRAYKEMLHPRDRRGKFRDKPSSLTAPLKLSSGKPDGSVGGQSRNERAAFSAVYSGKPRAVTVDGAVGKYRVTSVEKRGTELHADLVDADMRSKTYGRMRTVPVSKLSFPNASKPTEFANPSANPWQAVRKGGWRTPLTNFGPVTSFKPVVDYGPVTDFKGAYLRNVRMPNHPLGGLGLEPGDQITMQDGTKGSVTGQKGDMMTVKLADGRTKKVPRYVKGVPAAPPKGRVLQSPAKADAVSPILPNGLVNPEYLRRSQSDGV